MKQKNAVIYSFILVLVVIVGLFIGYLTSYLLKADNPPENDIGLEIYNTEPYTDEVTTEATNPPIYYLLKNENEVLKLYEVLGSSETLIKSINIASEFLPKEDQNKLKKGIKLESKEEGYEIIEDFSSWFVILLENQRKQKITKVNKGYFGLKE